MRAILMIIADIIGKQPHEVPLEQRRLSRVSTWCLSALSKVLASRGIVSAPIVRMDKRKYANPHSTVGVPEKWAQAAIYWYENGTHTLKVRKANYAFLLRVGRWLATEHANVEGPEQWDRKLAVELVQIEAAD
jgi:hypothetical protein